MRNEQTMCASILSHITHANFAFSHCSRIPQTLVSTNSPLPPMSAALPLQRIQHDLTCTKVAPSGQKTRIYSCSSHYFFLSRFCSLTSILYPPPSTLLLRSIYPTFAF